MAELVAEIEPRDDMLEELEKISEEFYPGDVGEVVLPLDRELATEREKDNIKEATKKLEQELRSAGMFPPLNRKLAELDWPARKVRIHFIAQNEPSAHVFEPSFFFLGGIAMAAARAAPLAARTTFVSSLVGRAGSVLNAGAIFVLIRGALLRMKKIPGFRFLFKTSNLIIGGALIWAMLDSDSFIQVFRTAGRFAGGVAGGVAGGLAKGIFEGSGILIVGAVAVGAGILILTRRG